MYRLRKVRRADVIDWNWTIDSGKLVVVPSSSTYLRYLLYLLLVPGLVLTALYLSDVTPWYFWNAPTVAESNASPHREDRAALKELVRERLELYGRPVNDEAVEQMVDNIEHQRAAREEQAKTRSARQRWVGRAFGVVVGVLWLVFVVLALLLTFILMRLPSARYEIFRERDGVFVMEIPKFVGVSTIILPPQQVVAAASGYIDYRTGRFGFPVRVWFVSVQQLGRMPLIKLCLEQENGHRTPPLVPSRTQRFLSDFARIMKIPVMDSFSDF